MKKMFALLTLIVLLLMMASATSADTMHRHTVVARLYPVGGSHVTGMVALKQLAGSGTFIEVNARNLQPGRQYLSIYYDNNACQLASDSIPNDVIGHYMANRRGRGETEGRVDDNLDQIHSVSVRLNDSPTHPTLLACAYF